MTGRRRPGQRYFAFPQRITNELSRAGVGPRARALLTAAWDFSATELTDGRLTDDEVRRLPAYRRADVEELTQARWFVPTDGAIELAHFLELNDTRAETEGYLSRQREKGAAGGRATGADRDSRGRFTEPATERTGRFSARSASAEPMVEHPYLYPDPHNEGNGYQELPDVRDRGIGMPSPRPEPWAGFGDEWLPFMREWQSRGFRKPPTDRQCAVLWPVVDSRPVDAGKWVREARGPKAADVVGEVLRRWDAFRGSVRTGEDPG